MSENRRGGIFYDSHCSRPKYPEIKKVVTVTAAQKIIKNSTLVRT